MSSKRVAKKIVASAVTSEKVGVATTAPTSLTRKRGRQTKNGNKMATEDESPYFKPDSHQPTVATVPAISKSKKKKQNQSESGRLNRGFYDQDTVTLAKAMLGKVLCRKLETGQILKGTIVETEAYTGEGDAASHSFKGVPTPASEPMFMAPGTAYVYMTYGMYYCFNISSKDNGGACLLRAVEVLEDYEIMQDLRRPKKKNPEAQTESIPPKPYKTHELGNGPSKLCLSFNITRDSCNKIDMTASEDLWLENSSDPKYSAQKFEMEITRRVGIDSTPPEARYQLYRFFVKDNICVSKAKFKESPVGKKRKGITASRKSRITS